MGLKNIKFTTDYTPACCRQACVSVVNNYFPFAGFLFFEVSLHIFYTVKVKQIDEVVL